MLDSGSYALALLAGALSTLSPCVLPLLPIVFGSAVSAHRWGVAALAGGLSLSFVLIGLFVATIGFSLGLDGEKFRFAAALLVFALGLVLVSQGLQDKLVSLASPLGARGQGLIERVNPAGLRGQFLLGLLLGAVWSPCVGPTLGAAATLAAQRESMAQVAVVMFVFGLGAALPMLVVGSVGRTVLARWRGRMLSAGKMGKRVLGIVMIALGLFIITGVDRIAETYLVEVSPGWLTDITTRF